MPKKVGRYELGKTLGTGNFSKVKLATDEEGKTWAMKIIDKAQLAKEHMEDQLKREIAVMKLLKHEHIIQLREVLQTANHIYLVLELVSGGELFDKIVAAKKFDEATTRRYFQQLMMGVYYCHQQGIAHRDLKPENLLLDGNDMLKISDFGLSNLQCGGPKGGGTLLQTVCGTPNYVAPEVLREKGYNGFQADVWSCGVILFVMLAGYLPFEDSNMNHLFNKIERGEYRMPKHFSADIQNLISRMLTVDATQRLTIEQVINHPWFCQSFDTSALERAKQDKIVIATDQLKGAVDDVQETNVPASAKAGASSGASASSGKGGSQAIDALQMINWMTSISVAPMVTGTNGLSKGATRILYGGSLEEASKGLTSVLDTLKASPKLKEGSAEIKGFVQAPKGLMTYVIVLVPTTAPNMTIVELRRGRGDVNDFQEFFKQIQSGCGNHARSTSIAQ